MNKEQRVQVIKEIHKAMEQRITYLYGRWMDEKECEDFADYSADMVKTFGKLSEPSYNMSFIKASKSPFGFTFMLDGCKVQITVNAKYYSWKVLTMAPDSDVAPLLHTVALPTETITTSSAPKAPAASKGVKERLRDMLLAAAENAKSGDDDGISEMDLCLRLGIDKKRLSDYICYLKNPKYAGSKGAMKITKLGDYYYSDPMDYHLIEGK